MTKWVYSFGNNKAEGSMHQRDLLGGKGANLAEMSNLGLAVPAGFTITTEACCWYYKNNRSYPIGLIEQVDQALEQISTLTGSRFGDLKNPLLLSVRSGSRASMPGMMDTVLNLGLNDETVKALAQYENERFAYDSYRRFIQMYSNVVFNIDYSIFEELLDQAKTSHNYESDTQMTASDWQVLIERYKDAVEEELGEAFPQEPQKQLWAAIGAVFSSWMNPRASIYRNLHSIPEEWGTAVNVQAMVFGNMGDDCATGVVFTRNPSTGVKELYGEFLTNAQGEDVVTGIRTPQNITEVARITSGSDRPSLEKLMPEAFADLTKIAHKLESHYGDMQDIEFTIEKGKLWMLQTRRGKRTANAALKIAAEMAQEGIISKKEAVLRIDPACLDQLLHPRIDPSAARQLIASGLPASPGAAFGEIVFSSQDAEIAALSGRKVILVRIETSPEDIHGMNAAAAILTTRGGMTSHAAVLARGMGKPCVCGAGAIKIDSHNNSMIAGDIVLNKGDILTIDGSTGQILLGRVAMLQPELSADFALIMQWADEKRRIEVRVNADNPADARLARSFGAQGIGLCRTEHMFFFAERIKNMRQMILSDNEVERRTALEKMLSMHRSDFIDLFEVMAGLPVAIRLLDIPLSEFLPKIFAEIAELAKMIGIDEKQLNEHINALREFNPMLRLRGVRLAIAYPEIIQMQVRAIFEAAIIAAQKANSIVIPEIIVPFVGLKSEFDFVKAQIDNVAKDVMKEQNLNFPYLVGAMIELPRAAIRASEIAQSADFFSFGTNDLTQATFGLSRDDDALLVNNYLQKGLLESDPFINIDIDGVGELISLAVKSGREARMDIKLGICGEHGGDPTSIAFFEKQRLDYISCSPFRVLIARLAAAQAVLKG